jgi:DNA invertase Pin-like site-specific DNA recombinase
MEAASRREFDTVLVWSLDGFSREGICKTSGHLKRLDSYGVRFRSYSESFLDTTGEFGELVVAIFAFWRRLKGDGSKRGSRRAWRALGRKERHWAGRGSL